MNTPQWQKDILDQGELYIVGGSVRNKLMGHRDDKDIDYLVRALTPDALETILRRHGKVEFVGRSFGVYKFTATEDHEIKDIAFPRREQSTGVLHRDFDVQWDPELPIEDDLGRRDFTMNAIAEDVRTGDVIDPFNGRRDIEDGMLRMIFPEAFNEDPLRILRGIRFAARFGLKIDLATYDAMTESAQLVKTLSAERVGEELAKLLDECDTPSVGFSLMHESGVLSQVLPELDRAFGVTQNEFHPDDVFWHSVKSCDAAPRDKRVIRWAALLHDVGKVDKKQIVTEKGTERVVFYGHEKVSATMTEDVLKRLRCSNDTIKHCTHLVAHHMFNYEPEWTAATVRRFIRNVGEANLDDLFLLREADCRSRDLTDELDNLADLKRRVREELDAKRALKIEDLAIDGRDVMDVLGLDEGAEVGRILKSLFERVLEDPSLNKRETLLTELQKRDK